MAQIFGVLKQKLLVFIEFLDIFPTFEAFLPKKKPGNFLVKITFGQIARKKACIHTHHCPDSIATK